MAPDDLTNYGVVTLAAALLGGAQQYVHREHIAKKADSLAPGRFAWQYYADQIDLDAIGVALRDAKKLKNGALLIGDNAKGWMLSPPGVRWVLGLTPNAAGPVGGDLELAKHAIEEALERERLRLRRCRAYELYRDGAVSTITANDYAEFAHLNEYFDGRARRRRYAIVTSAVEGDTTLLNLWRCLFERFGQEEQP